MNVVAEDDYVTLLLVDACKGAWEVKGRVRHRNDTEAVIDVDTPGRLDTITVADGDPWDEELTAFRSRTSVRMASVEVIRLRKVAGTQPSSGRLSTATADE